MVTHVDRLPIINLHTKFEVSMFTHCEDINPNPEA